MQVQEAEAEEKRQKEERRMQLKKITEQDRADKQQFKSGVQAPKENPENLMSKVFDRPTHQAYERRAKQEQVQNMIVEKFDKTSIDAKKNVLINEQGKVLNDQTDAMLAREAHRKDQEAKMKQVLDMQVLRAHQAKQVSAAEKKAAFD